MNNVLSATAENLRTCKTKQSREMQEYLEVPWQDWIDSDNPRHRYFVEQLTHQHKLFNQGEVTWGVIVRANSSLHKVGRHGAPSNIIYCHHRNPEQQLEKLFHVADAINALNDRTNVRNEDELKIHEFLADERGAPLHHRVPESLAGDLEVYYSTTMIVRGHLEFNVLVDDAFPLLIHPETPGVMMVPSRLWETKFKKLSHERAVAETVHELESGQGKITILTRLFKAFGWLLSFRMWYFAPLCLLIFPLMTFEYFAYTAGKSKKLVQDPIQLQELDNHDFIGFDAKMDYGNQVLYENDDEHIDLIPVIGNESIVIVARPRGINLDHEIGIGVNEHVQGFMQKKSSLGNNWHSAHESINLFDQFEDSAIDITPQTVLVAEGLKPGMKWWKILLWIISGLVILFSIRRLIKSMRIMFSREYFVNELRWDLIDEQIETDGD